jgi:thymidylate kinase
MKISFTGAHCTGKTTLLNSIAQIYDGQDGFHAIKETARVAFSKGYPLGREATSDTYIYCAKEQIKKIQQSAKYSIVISDRTLLDTYVYALLSATDEKAVKISSNLIELLYYSFLMESCYYDIYIYFPLEFPLVHEYIRPKDENYREIIDNKIKSILDKQSLNYLTISGHKDKRLQDILSLIESNSIK